MFAWIARILARWAHHATIQARVDAESEAKEQRAIVAQRDSRIALLEAEVAFLAQWRDAELAVLEKKAAIERIAKTASTELPERE